MVLLPALKVSALIITQDLKPLLVHKNKKIKKLKK